MRTPLRLTVWSLSPLFLLAGTAHAQSLANGVYTLVTKTGSLALDNEGASTPNAVWQWTSALGNTNQEWKITSLGNGVYSLVSVTSGLALDNGGTQTDGTPTQQAVSAPTSLTQQWQIVSVGKGYYQLINKFSNKALDNSGATTNGGSVWQWTADPSNPNQSWLIAPVQIGAKTNFTSYEAESGTLGGGASVVSLTAPPTTKFSSPELEASGHSYVHLAAVGQSVSWTNNTGAPVTAINVRYSIPDAPGGGGITSTLDLYVNGALRQALPVNSKQSWIYETDSDYNGQSKSPSYGSPHKFWDEVHTFITGAAVPPGGTITLQQDAANTAAYYNVDVVDVEQPPPPLTQPANSISIANYGAVPNDISKDSTSAILSAVSAAESQGMTVWVPQGTYYLNTPQDIGLQNTTLEGAGMWYSTIYYNPPLPTTVTANIVSSYSASIKNITLDGNAVDDAAGGGNGGGILINGNNWVVDGVWVEHEGAGIWADGTNGTVQNCRLDDTWADGININNGNGGSGNTTGNNLTVFNNFIRGSGDDGIAINSSGYSTSVAMQSPTVIQNTTVAPWWSNNMGIYGSTNATVTNNLFTDSVKEYGISIGTFTAAAGSLSNAVVEGNTVLRGGSFGYAFQYPAIGIGVTNVGLSAVQGVTVRGNTVIDSMFDGLDFEAYGANVTVQGNLVQSPGLDGFSTLSYAVGNASYFYNTATGIASGQQAYDDTASPQNLIINSVGNTQQ